MTEARIQISDRLFRLAERRAAECGFPSFEEYIDALIHRDVEDSSTDQQPRGTYWDEHADELNRAIQHAIDSGPPEPWTHEDLMRAKQRFIERHQKRNKTA